MTQLQVVQLHEYAGGAPKGIDKEAGVIRGVKILGKDSPQNNREYSDQALNELVGLYENVTVCVDHDPKNPRTRKVEDGFGTIKNVRRDGDAVYGDLHYLREHPKCNLILERAERMPDRFGLSHSAYGQERRGRNGKSQIEHVDRVHTVDLVDNPSTNKNLFEQPAATEEAEDPTAAMEQGIEQMVMAVLREDADVPSKLKKIRKILRAKESIMADDAEPEEESEEEETEEPESPPEDEEMSEQANSQVTEALEKVTSRLDRLEKRDRIGSILLEQGFSWSDIDADQEKELFEQEDDAKVKAIVDTWDRPTLPMRRSRTGPIFEQSELTRENLPADAKSFAAAVR